MFTKSFEINYNGGSIWAEELDGMGSKEYEVMTKFIDDFRTAMRPSSSSFMIINLDRTNLTQQIAMTILAQFSRCNKQFRRIALVGVPKHQQFLFTGLGHESCAMVSFIDNYEEAKRWCVA